jgi:DNA-binding GntR family transcriptional regulator
MVETAPIEDADDDVEAVDRSQPAKLQAYEYVRGEILRDSINEPHFLTEEMVGRALGLSRTPVREAFLMLEAEGLLQLVSRKGALILPITERQVREVTEVRSVVESWSATQALADPRLCERLIATLRALQEDLVAIGDDDPTALIECDRAFHRAIIAAAGNQVMLELYERMRDLQLRMGVRAVLGDPERAAAVRAEHQLIIDAFAGGSEHRILAAINGHLDVTAQNLRRRVGSA